MKKLDEDPIFLVEEKTSFLENNEKYLLRLVLHDCSTIEICNFLNLDLDGLSKLKKTMIQKFKVSTWQEVLVTTITRELLNLEDYISDDVRDIALDTANEILFDKEVKTFSVDLLKDVLLDFLNACTQTLAENYRGRFSAKEKKYVALKFKEIPLDEISKRLKLSSEAMMNLDKDLIIKLGVNHWFNGFKRAFNLNIIRNKESILDKEVEALIVASRIAAYNASKNISIKVKKLKIYHELAKLYSKIEFGHLHTASTLHPD